jgi:hypothetical protein
MESEIRARSWLSFADLATPLVFVQQPSENGMYEHKFTHIPNTGKFMLNPGDRVNQSFLEHENRLRELLGLAHLLPPCAAKDQLEDRIFRELNRASLEKEIHWSQQRMDVDIGRVVVNTGMHVIFKR